MGEDFSIEKGTYVVAVSGGVDSMVLLDLVRMSGNEHVVAHYVHNVRSEAEAAADLEVIKRYCDTFNLELVIGAYPDDDKTESAMREARYAFLEKVRSDKNYNAVITAHHLDDRVETAIFNLLRGTRSKGLVGFGQTNNLLRPLMYWTKQDILDYATKNDIAWHEDSTNTDQAYTRNYIRHTIIPKLKGAGVYDEFVQHIVDQVPIESEMSEVLEEISNANYLRYENGIGIERSWFIQLPHVVSCAILHDLLAKQQFSVELNAQAIDKAVVFSKTAKRGTSLDVSKRAKLVVDANMIKILQRD